jgi:hypothetical protein
MFNVSSGWEITLQQNKTLKKWNGFPLMIWEVYLDYFGKSEGASVIDAPLES